MKMKFALIILFVFVSQLFPQQNNVEITLEELSEHLFYLASEELEGRKPGTEGGSKAAKYIKDNLQNSGLIPLSEKGFQYFEVLTSIEYGSDNKLSFLNYDGELNKDFVPLAFSKDTSITSTAVFVGYGFDFEGDSISWHSYEGVDVADKWAIIFRGSPDDDGHNSPYTMYSSLRQKTLKARDKGAAGVIFISGKEFDDTDELIPITHEKAPTHIGLPVIHVKRSKIDKLLEKFEVTTVLLEKQLIETTAPNSFEIEEPITISTDVERLQNKTQNVEFMIEGSDPILKDEYIVIGAHYDHLGTEEAAREAGGPIQTLFITVLMITRQVWHLF
jgi:aminopeptidase YwaD